MISTLLRAGFSLFQCNGAPVTHKQRQALLLYSHCHSQISWSRVLLRYKVTLGFRTSCAVCAIATKSPRRYIPDLDIHQMKNLIGGGDTKPIVGFGIVILVLERTRHNAATRRGSRQRQKEAVLLLGCRIRRSR